MAISPILPVYRRSKITMVRGEGVYLFDDKGKRYLDFATGIAVNALGHAHPHTVKALQAQAEKLWHCSNMYHHPGLDRLAQRYVDATFADTVFFCSTGTEAVETGLKMARRYHHAKGANKYRTITFEGGFHGRSFAGISAGGNESARLGYGPLLEGFDSVAWNDIDAVKDALTEETAAILIEPIQGEGGIRVADDGFLRELRSLTDQYDVLLITDEVQCGLGRSGHMFAFEYAGITPDIASIAKGIGNGFPLAACLATEKAASGMTPGSHGSTYGANPLAMAVGNAVLDVMLQPDFLPYVMEIGKLLQDQLEQLKLRFPHILLEVRGRGLMLGIQTATDRYELVNRLRENGLLTSPAAGDEIIRILPPLIIDSGHVEEAISLLSQTLESL